MKERPILFSGEMVNAILDGRKTQTRRPMKKEVIHACPYGEVGDRLWVRESWQVWTAYNNVKNADLPEIACANINYPANGNVWDARIRPSIHMPRWASRILLEIVNIRVARLQDISEDDIFAEGARYDDGIYNGIRIYRPTWWLDGTGFTSSPRSAFAGVWEREHGFKSWDKNPLVWVLEFRRVSL